MGVAIVGHMANVTFKNEPTTTVGNLPVEGDQLPNLTLVGTDLSEINTSEFQGKRLVISTFPSVDTGTCAQTLRTFNEKAASLDNTVVLNASKDLPFAQARFCAAEGIENVEVGSAFRTSFGEELGVTLEGSPLKGLLTRAVIVTDTDHKVTYVQLVEEISEEPDYDAVIAALN